MTSTTTWVEIATNRLSSNLSEIRKLLAPGTMVMPTVKANAYGHGLALASQSFAQAGADWLAVHSVPEARAVRRSGVTLPILIIGYVTDEQLSEVISAGWSLVWYDEGRLPNLAELSRRSNTTVNIHLKVETGINRQGLDPATLLRLAEYLRPNQYVRVQGICSHFANIEDTTNSDFAQEQHQLFRQAVSMTERALGYAIPHRHIANSAATILYPDTHETLVRPGIACYGIWPSRLVQDASQQRADTPQLRPAMRWLARIAQVKSVGPGDTIGYGRSFLVKNPMRIAVLPVGYYEGYDRSAGPQASVLIGNQRCPVVGRVCMNNIMVDVTKVPSCQSGDVAVLLGWSSYDEITSDEFASWTTNRINYEIPTRIGAGIDESVPRLAIIAP